MKIAVSSFIKASNILKTTDKNNTAAIGDKAVRRTSLFQRILNVISAVAAAGVIIFALPVIPMPGNNISMVHSAEKAFRGIKAYHGKLILAEADSRGEIINNSELEVWADLEGRYYVKVLEGGLKGLVTVNNGQMKWQLRPGENKAYILPANPDPYLFTFELGNEIYDLKAAAAVNEIGGDTVSGRKALLYEITPEDGAAYELWIDKATGLPLQKQSELQDGLQIKTVYKTLDYKKCIPAELLEYKLPKGYEEVKNSTEQLAVSLEEVKNKAGIVPMLPAVSYFGYSLSAMSVTIDTQTIKLIYKSSDEKNTINVLQENASAEFRPDSRAIRGNMNNNPAEILISYKMADNNSIRWQEDGRLYTVAGNAGLKVLSAFAEEISGGNAVIPSMAEPSSFEPQIKIPYDLKVEENNQKSVDEGHSPWRLDPAFVAQVFVNVLISPEGIVGDYKIPYEDIKIISSNSKEAIAEINNRQTIAKYVYLKRLVRQDDTGIWTVVGYDPVNTSE